MKKAKEKTPLDGGFGARLAFAIIFTIIATVFLLLFAIIIGVSGFYLGTQIITIFGVLAAFCSVIAAIGYIGAFAGKKHKWADKMMIVIGVLLSLWLLGIPALVGGVIGKRDIEDPQRIVNRQIKNQKYTGFALRLTFAILILSFAIVYTLSMAFGIPGLSFDILFLCIILPGIIIFVLGVLLLIAAFAGKKHKWGNVFHIVLGVITCAGVIGIPALIGGIRGNNALNRVRAGKEEQSQNNAEQTEAAGEELTKGETDTAAGGVALTDFPIDYENKPAVSRLLDLNNRENLFLENENGEKYEFHQLYVTVKNGSLYVLTETVGLDENERVVFCVDYYSDTFNIEKDENVCEEVWNEYVAAVKAQQAEEETAPEFIRPKTSPKVKKGITIAAAVSYGLLLIMGILLASVPAMGNVLSGMGICEDISARAYGITIGVMWVALVPSFGYYFATVAPFNLSKKTKIIISAVSVALSLIMLAVFFIVIFAAKIDGIAVKDFYEDSDSWFIPASMVFASLALMVCHALTFFKINPNKIRARKPQKSGDGIFDMIKYVLANIVYGLMCLLKAILTFKELLPEVFILVATILLTWLAHFVSFVVAILVIVLLIGGVVMYFAGVISLGFDESSSQEKTVLTVDGKTVTEQPYVIDDRYQKVYKDENGNEYVSDDGGKTVREYHRFNDN